MALGSAESQGHAGEVEVRELGDGDLVQQGRQETLFGEPLPDHEERLYGAPLRLGEVHQGGVGEHPQGEVAEKAMKTEQKAAGYTGKSRRRRRKKQGKCNFDIKASLTKKNFKVTLELIKTIFLCYKGGNWKFTAAFEFNKKSRWRVERFLAQLFPGRFTVRAKKMSTDTVQIFKACVPLTKDKVLSPTVTMLGPQLCYKKRKYWHKWSRTWKSKPTMIIELAMRVKVKADNLKLIGRFYLQDNEAQIRVRMQGLWNAPMGIKGLAVDNLELGIGIMFKNPPFWPPARYVFGGAVGFGSECHLAMKNMPKKGGVLIMPSNHATGKGKSLGEVAWSGSEKFVAGSENSSSGNSTASKRHKCIFGRLCLSMHRSKKQQNFISIQISRLMLTDVIDWFAFVIGKKIDTTKFGSLMKQTGFPMGLALSIAPITQLAPGGFVIPEGINFSGAMNILGWKAFMKLEISKPSKKFVLMASISPIRLFNGKILISRSATDKTKGPKWITSIKEGTYSKCVKVKEGPMKGLKKCTGVTLPNGEPLKSFKINIDIEGYIKVFGIGLYTKIVVKTHHFYFVAEVTLFLGFKGRLEVKMELPFGKFKELGVVKAMARTRLDFILSLTIVPWQKLNKEGKPWGRKDNLGGLNGLIPQVFEQLGKKVTAATRKVTEIIRRIKKKFKMSEEMGEAMLRHAEEELGEGTPESEIEAEIANDNKIMDGIDDDPQLRYANKVLHLSMSDILKDKYEKDEEELGDSSGEHGTWRRRRRSSRRRRKKSTRRRRVQMGNKPKCKRCMNYKATCRHNIECKSNICKGNMSGMKDGKCATAAERNKMGAVGHGAKDKLKAKYDKAINGPKRLLAQLEKLKRTLKHGDQRMPPHRKLVWLCGGWVRGRIGVVVPPMVEAEIQMLVYGRRSSLRVYMDTGSMKRTADKMASALFPMLKNIAGAARGPGNDRCKFPVPLVTVPPKKPMKSKITKALPDPKVFNKKLKPLKSQEADEEKVPIDPERDYNKAVQKTKNDTDTASEVKKKDQFLTKDKKKEVAATKKAVSRRAVFKRQAKRKALSRRAVFKRQAKRTQGDGHATKVTKGRRNAITRMRRKVRVKRAKIAIEKYNKATTTTYYAKKVPGSSTGGSYRFKSSTSIAQQAVWDPDNKKFGLYVIGFEAGMGLKDSTHSTKLVHSKLSRSEFAMFAAGFAAGQSAKANGNTELLGEISHETQRAQVKRRHWHYLSQRLGLSDAFGGQHLRN